ncbi:hypothetical protein THIX_60738 [Thiomonas sp. X19]|uniref:hypothetical protein n=1 Tax=Thiomonas sp. X19 TaxID=1050370 RepID=UPI000B6702AC|nr:hypothetical protein [Thiomonas sp. X19]SCC94680.1 hypothetical protein THIX_60738 [Thiomonas sp. X19]
MSAFQHAVLSNLEAQGWKIGKSHQAREGTMHRANDGGGSTEAQAILIKDSGIAVITSHRGSLDLPKPWREGREASDGSPTRYITARDLGIEVAADPRCPPAPPARRAADQAHVAVAAHDPLDADCVAGVLAAWYAGPVPRDDHPQLVKGGAWVHPSGLREFPVDHKNAGDLLAPLFRPVSPTSRSVELCGGQQLLRNTEATPDKYVLAGSKMSGAFVPLPLPTRDAMFTPPGCKPDLRAALNMEGRSNPGLLAQLAPSCDLGASWLRPGARIVVVEGVRTGQAIRTATAGWGSPAGSVKDTVVLAALSANNLPAVARWLKASGLAAKHEIVFAADNDLQKSDFVGIRKAVEAAQICGGKVALVDNHKPGFDAHDILKERKHDLRAGLAAVREFIDTARSPQQVRADQADAFASPVPSQDPGRGKDIGRGGDAGVSR